MTVAAVSGRGVRERPRAVELLVGITRFDLAQLGMAGIEGAEERPVARILLVEGHAERVVRVLAFVVGHLHDALDGPTERRVAPRNRVDQQRAIVRCAGDVVASRIDRRRRLRICVERKSEVQPLVALPVELLHIVELNRHRATQAHVKTRGVLVDERSLDRGIDGAVAATASSR